MQPRTRSIGPNISHSCRWFPGILLPSRILRYFCLRLLIMILTRHCCALLEYPPSAIPWLILSHRVCCCAWCLTLVAPPLHSIRPCHTAAILSRENKKPLFYHAKPHPHGFHCEAWRRKTKLFWSPASGFFWPPRDKGE